MSPRLAVFLCGTTNCLTPLPDRARQQRAPSRIAPPATAGNWSEDRVQNALEVEKEKKLLETTGGQVATEHRKDGRKVFNTMRTMPDLGFAPVRHLHSRNKGHSFAVPRHKRLTAYETS